jgi:hypothetical protein
LLVDIAIIDFKGAALARFDVLLDDSLATERRMGHTSFRIISGFVTNIANSLCAEVGDPYMASYSNRRALRDRQRRGNQRNALPLESAKTPFWWLQQGFIDGMAEAGVKLKNEDGEDVNPE